MRTKLTLVAASLATLMMTTAHAAPPPAEADLSITAKVVPSACHMQLSRNGIVDYGDIPASTLSATGNTLLRLHHLQYQITCHAPTAISLNVFDNRRGTATAHIGDSFYSYGLGQENGVNIGSNQYRVIKSMVDVDGAPGSPLRSPDGQYNWVGMGATEAFRETGWYSFANSIVGANVAASPSLITTVVGILEVEASIAPRSSFDLTQVINIDGFATMQLYYI